MANSADDHVVMIEEDTGGEIGNAGSFSVNMTEDDAGDQTVSVMQSKYELPMASSGLCP